MGMKFTLLDSLHIHMVLLMSWPTATFLGFSSVLAALPPTVCLAWWIGSRPNAVVAGLEISLRGLLAPMVKGTNTILEINLAGLRALLCPSGGMLWAAEFKVPDVEHLYGPKEPKDGANSVLCRHFQLAYPNRSALCSNLKLCFLGVLLTSITKADRLFRGKPPAKMTYSVLLLGATSKVGHKTLKELALRKQHFSRVAFLLPPAATAYEEEVDHAFTILERIFGCPSDSSSYKGFEIVVSAVEDDICAKQMEYAEAAFAGGVKHFYPAEYGPDLNHPAIRDELYFADKIALRKQIESRAQADSSLGFTCVVTGALSDFLLESNALGLGEDERSAIYLGNPDSRISITHSDDVAKLIVASLLPHHLSNLNVRRYLCLAGSTLPTLSLFDAISYVLRRPLDVTYESRYGSTENETQQKPTGNALQQSFRRSLGFGGFELKEQDVAHSEREFKHEVKPKTWAQMVYEFFTSREQRTGMIK